MWGGKSLKDILTRDDDDMSDVDMPFSRGPNGQSESNSSECKPGVCVECSESSTVLCMQCEDEFCDICFQQQHKKGSRTKHKIRRLASKDADDDDEEFLDSHETLPDDSNEKGGMLTAASSWISSLPLLRDWIHSEPMKTVEPEFFIERSKFIPIRLTMKERKFLRLIQGTLEAADYTDKIDSPVYKTSMRRLHAQIKEVCSLLTGIIVAIDFEEGRKLMEESNFDDFEAEFQKCFEIARRHKIMNPGRNRGSYGKLMYMLQDSMLPEVSELLGFSCVKPVETVYSFLKQRDALALLSDPNMSVATMEILPEGKSRSQINSEIKSKERAIKHLGKRYSSEEISVADVERCVYSIGDNHSYLRQSRDPCLKMIQYLMQNFSPDKVEDGFSLAISEGTDGARLSHSHERQYHYVMQSLSLWSEITHEMFKLWYLAEMDLLAGDSPYRLTDTGQGLHRVQECPRVGRAMRELLHNAQRRVGHWVGSSVIHLGDHNVPNSLMFIDKYNQIEKILGPIVTCLSNLDRIAENKHIMGYILARHESVDRLKKEILCDFFKYGFDGSGADNFVDAGSCIDGRLTSAWNWCSSITQKPFHPVFVMTGFVGFDGMF
eukprot:Rmarinus@m.581